MIIYICHDSAGDIVLFMTGRNYYLHNYVRTFIFRVMTLAYFFCSNPSIVLTLCIRLIFYAYYIQITKTIYISKVRKRSFTEFKYYFICIMFYI